MLVAVDAKTQTLSDSLARRTGGSDSPLMRLLTFAPLSRCSLGPLGPDDLPPASLLPPLKGRAVIVIERGSVSWRGREDKATVTGRISGRSLALSGGSNRDDRVPTGNREGGSWPHGAVTGRISGLSRCVPGRALRKIKNLILRNCVISQIGQRNAFTFTLRTAESYMLSRR